jgi:hypothetical protein
VKKTTFERWVDKVDMKGPDDCWEWLAAKHRFGYGCFKTNKKLILAHRFSYTHYKNNGQPMPSNLCVCHHCDNPGCVNPNHLFLGTHTDNMKDMLRKGRNRFKLNPRPKKHTDDEVDKIREEYSSGLSLRKVAKLNNTSDYTVHKIIHHKPPYER